MSDAPAQPAPAKWRHSLIVRVVALCAVLVLCLLAMVYFLTTRYYSQVITHMEQRADNITEQVRLVLEERLRLDEELSDTDDLQSLAEGTPIQLDFNPIDPEPSAIRSEADDRGYYFMAEQTFELSNGALVLVQMELDFDPQTEVIRAFQNRNLLAITAVFLVTLGMMVYLIVSALRPLRDLSDSCARIAEGELQDVSVKASASEIVALEETFNGMVASLKEKEIVESNLRQAQRLSAIGNLAAGVAHDIRNPLNAIKLLSSHALDALEADPTSESATKQIRTIRNEVDRLENIVSGFLSLAKEEELHFETAPLDAMLTECLNLVKQDAEARKIRLTHELRAGDTALDMDPQKMTRAVLNVLINALEACPEGGRVRLFSRVADDSCEIDIRDDGPGMPDDVMERVFDPYFTTKTTGTGLGLSITRGIVEEHQGTIAITSTEDRGCQVLITLPLKRAAIQD